MNTLVMKTKKSNSGFTLVELLVTIAILGFVIVAIGGALISSAKSYRSGSVEVDLQQQSQITANLISSLVQDAAEVNFVAGKLEIKQEKGSDVVVYTIEKTTDPNGKNILQYTVTDTTLAGGSETGTLAENITDDGFNVDIGNFDGYKNVAITLEFEESGRTFKTTYNMTARNGNGETATSVLALNNVVLEPGGDHLFKPITNRDIVWPTFSNANGSKLVVNPDGSATFFVGKAEDASYLTFDVSTVPVDAGEPAITQTVYVYVRRVAKIDFDDYRSGNKYEAGTTYKIVPKFTDASNTNMKPVSNAINGPYAYQDFEDVEWSIVSGSEFIRPGYQAINFTNSSTATVCSFQLELAQDLDVGDKIVIRATAIRPKVTSSNPKSKHYGCATDFNKDVFADYVIEKKDDIRRGWYFDFPKIEGQELSKYPQCQGKYLFRYSQPNMLDPTKTETWVGSVWDTEGGTDKAGYYELDGTYKAGSYRIQENNFLKNLDPTKSYVIQMAFVPIPNGQNQDVSNCRAIINGYTDEQFKDRVTTFQIDAATIKFTKVTTDGTTKSVSSGASLGTESAPLNIKYDGESLLEFETFAHSNKYFQEHLKIVKVQVWDGTKWVNANGISTDSWISKELCGVSHPGATDTCVLHGKLRLRNPINYGFENNKKYKIYLDWYNQAQEGDTLHFYDESSGKGILYFKMY